MSSSVVVAGALAACAAALLAAHLAAIVWSSGQETQIASWFHLDRERNLPTLYSAALLLLVALVLVDTGHEKRRAGAEVWRSWYFLATCFVLLSVDEAVQFHESFSARTALIMESLNLSLPLLYWMPWVIPYGAFAVLIGLFSLRFLHSLDATTKLRVVVAGAIYLLGAIGIEIIGAARIEALGGWTVENDWDPTYIVLITIEEVFEIGGVSLMLYALVRYEQEQFGGVLLNTSPVTALGLLLAGSLAVALLSDPLRTQLGGRASLLLLVGGFFVVMVLTIFGKRRSRRDRRTPQV